MNKLILVFAAAVAISCGDNKKEEKPAMQIGTQVEEAAPAQSSDSQVAEITITGNDQMKFDKSEIRVKAGQKVRLTLKHVGKMDKTVMGHNWALLTKDADMAAVGQASAVASETDYIPTDMQDKFIAYTKMLGGGETDTIEFDAPEPGTYTFMCTFPGHYALMNGKFIVE
ncbi:azurin [Aequorivita sp. SDUM287046]|uniref:Azurin n=1 Tax=Aequorivita aurantiaca TaxID=3053356 RepID=A0ABT8DLC6_9FLAO|nr:azurin [Aequorivita aurantiaca]MDN3723950.1 azurin [Aequorivita aurantiaca]